MKQGRGWFREAAQPGDPGPGMMLRANREARWSPCQHQGSSENGCPVECSVTFSFVGRYFAFSFPHHPPNPPSCPRLATTLDKELPSSGPFSFPTCKVTEGSLSSPHRRGEGTSLPQPPALCCTSALPGFCTFVEETPPPEYPTRGFLSLQSFTSPFFCWVSLCLATRASWGQRTRSLEMAVICFNLCYFSCERKAAGLKDGSGTEAEGLPQRPEVREWWSISIKKHGGQRGLSFPPKQESGPEGGWGPHKTRNR